MKMAVLLTAVLSVFSGISAAQGGWGAGTAPELVALKRISVSVVTVTDGDTVRVREFQNAIRIASIDAPETSHARKRPGQPFSQASRTALIGLLGGGRRIEAYCYERDRYERPVCDLYADNESVGRALVASGLAWANEGGGGRYLRDRQLLTLEHQAQERKAGLWADRRPIEPWVWRNRCWRQEQCASNTED